MTTTGALEMAAAIPAAGFVGSQGQSVYVVVLRTSVLVTVPEVMTVSVSPSVEASAVT